MVRIILYIDERRFADDYCSIKTAENYFCLEFFNIHRCFYFYFFICMVCKDTSARCAL